MLFNSTGFLVLNKIQSYHNQQETAAILRGKYHRPETKDIILYPTQFEQLNWHGKEFEFNGAMYALVSMKKKSNQYFLTCYYDAQETLTKNNFKKYLADQSSSDNDDNKLVLKKLFKDFFIEETHPVLEKDRIKFIESSELNYRYLLGKDFSFYGRTTPPPKIS